MDDFFTSNPEELKNYNKWYAEWLDKNKDLLEQSFKIEPMIIPSKPTKYKMNKELTEYIKNTNWYMDNYTVREADNLLSKKITINKELQILLTKALEIAPGKKTDKEIKSYTDQLKDVEKELGFDKKIHSKFWECSTTQISVQEYFDQYDLEI